MPEKVPIFNYAIWAAVSSDAQAQPDKFSLQEQVNRCRAYANEKGWQETVTPAYQMVGSRTRFVDLSAAAHANPELARMLADAQAGKFNLLVMWHYDRLRDHLQSVAKVLESRGIQLFSLNQPTPL